MEGLQSHSGVQFVRLHPKRLVSIGSYDTKGITNFFIAGDDFAFQSFPGTAWGVRRQVLDTCTDRGDGFSNTCDFMRFGIIYDHHLTQPHAGSKGPFHVATENVPVSATLNNCYSDPSFADWRES